MAAAVALSLKILFHGTSQPSQSAQKQSWAVQRKGASPFGFKGMSMETETTTSSECPNGEKTTVTMVKSKK